MATVGKSFSVFEFAKTFEQYMKPTLCKYPLENGHRYALHRFINFNSHRVVIELSRHDGKELELVASFTFQNLRPSGEGGSFKGYIFHSGDNRQYDFLFLIETSVQLTTLAYELLKYFDALMTGNPLPEAIDEMLASNYSVESVHNDDDLLEADIENMSDEEIQRMMEQEVARTRGETGVAGNGDDAENGIPSGSEAAVSTAGNKTTDLSIDDIQNMLMGGGSSAVDAAEALPVDTNEAADEPLGQDALNDILGGLGVAQHSEDDQPEATAAESPAAAAEDGSENLTPEEIEKMVIEKQAQEES